MKRIYLLLALLFLTAGGSAAQNAVGSLGGEVAVTHTGLATYSIPIDVVPGTRGVQPSLAVTYNSDGGRGMLGSCWTLTGFSSIARTPRDFYHDGDAGSVNFDGRDRYTLDGARLVRLSSGSYAATGAVYGKEEEDFTRVTLCGTPDTESQYFTAVAADGTMVEYGNSADSRQKLDTLVLSWWVNKVTDPDGNYMEFSYSLLNGDILPESISYTKNPSAGLSHYAFVHFSYIQDTLPNRVWVGGKPITATKLLSGISVWYGQTKVREYAFEYNHDRSSRLSAVVLKDGSGVELTRTSVGWGSDGQSSTFQTVCGLQGYNIKTGDFNGDNLTDLLLYTFDSDTQTTEWTVAKGDGAGHFSQTALTGTISGGSNTYGSIATADYDGNGIDDIGYIRQDSDSVRFYAITFLGNTHHTRSLSSNTTTKFLVGRFLGTGGLQVLRVSPPIGNTRTITCLENGEEVIVHKDARLGVTDANGNGKSEIQAVREHGVDVYEYNAASGYFSQIIDHYMEQVSVKDWFGDFNGDGYTDYVYYAPDGFHLKVSKGNDYCPSVDLPLNPTQSNDGKPRWPLVVGDANGDGKDDIIQPILDNNAQQLTLNTYLSRRCLSGLWIHDTVQLHHSGVTHEYEGMYTFAEMDGDGKDELFYAGSINQDPVIVGFSEGRGHDLACSFTDGYGKTTGVLYGYYSTPDIGYFGHSGKRVRWPLVRAVLEPDGIGGTAATFHSYGMPINDPLRGVIGFQYHERYKDGTNTYFQFQHDNVYHRAALEQCAVYYRTRNTDWIGGYISDPDFWDLRRDQMIIHAEIYNTPAVLPLDFGRVVCYDSVSSSIDRLGNTVRTAGTRLTAEGRVLWTSSYVRREKGQNGSAPPWIERDSTVYAYVTVTLPNGSQVKKPSSVTSWHRRNGYGQAPWRRTSYAYSSGRLSTATATDADGQVSVTSYAYNAFGHPVTVTLSPSGLDPMATGYAYDSKGRFATRMTDPMGNVTMTEYDRFTGLPVSETDINDLTTSLVRDAFGRVVQETRPDGTVRNVSYQWDSLSFSDAVWCVRETGSGRPETRTWHDVLGRTVHTYRAGSGYHDVVRDSLGRVVRATAVPYPYATSLPMVKTWTETAYDRYGRVVAESGPYTSLSYAYHDPAVSEDYYVTVTDSIRSTRRTLTYDGAGRLVRSEDAGGALTYAYGYATRDGRTLDSTAVAFGGSVTVALSDIRGNRVELRDPDAGTVTSTYDALGRLVGSTDANGTVTSHTYDLLGRVTRTVRSDGVTQEAVETVYDSAPGKGKGRVHKVRRDGSDELDYAYDTLGRLSLAEVADGPESYFQRYSYDALGRLDSLCYPDGFAVRHSYNSLGELAAVTDAATDSLLFAIDTRNGLRQPLKCRYGNGTGVQYTRNAVGLPTAVRNGDVTYSTHIHGLGPGIGLDVDYSVGTEYRRRAYAYDARGFLASQSDANTGQSEAYTYDTLDRLVSYTVNGVTAGSFTYDGKGNITANSRVGSYAYGDAGPHAVTAVTGVFACPVPNATCEVSYGLWNRPVSIAENGYRAAIDYGADGMRRHTRFYHNNTLQRTVTRVSDLHEVQTAGSAVRRLDYVYAEGRVVAVHVQNGSADSLYYVLEDRLGSWEIVMDQAKNAVQRTHFDPWGNRMSYTAWNSRQTQVAFPFSRGFTGHEHYDRFKIINANARLYDPVIGRFFSPDPYVQAPDFTQSFNRYSYCMNNPVMYRDPYGYYVTYGGNHYDPNGPLEQSIVDGHVAYVLPEVTITPDDNTPDTWNEFVYNPSTNSGGYTDWNYLNYGNNSNSSNGSGGSGGGGNMGGGIIHSTPNYNGKNQNHNEDLAVAVLTTMAGVSIVEPSPIGEAVTTVAAGAATLYYGKELITKMEAEIAHLLTRQDGPDGFVYLLCVKTDGNYPCVNGSALFVELEAGDIWKIGETTQINGGRYSEKLLNSIGTGGVQQIPIIYGNQREIKIYEKYMIYGYYYKYGHLPPGNKIFR